MFSCSVGIALIYQFVCFVDIPGLTTFQSEIIYWLLMIILIPLGTYITFEKRRNFLSVIVNVLLPLEIYITLTTFSYIPAAYHIVLPFACGLSWLYFAMIIRQKIKQRRYAKEIIRNRIKHALLGARTIIAVCLLCISIPVCVKSVLGQGLVSSNVETKVETESDQWTLSNNIEVVALLHEDNWKTLSLQEKLDVLGVCKNIEMNYLGITQEIELIAEDLEEGTLGTYKSNDNTIAIDIEHLKNDEPKLVLTSLTHECKHVYDMACVDLFNSIDDDAKKLRLFKNIAKFDEEFSNYIDGDEDELGYYFQMVEVSARQYSEQAVEEYFEAINKYLENPGDYKTEE